MSKRRNLRDEEARVIGVQDDAAQEMRRVKARRPHDAAERRDKKSQESRVGSRERNARDEMTRLRGKAVGMGMKTGGKTVKKAKGGSSSEGWMSNTMKAIKAHDAAKAAKKADRDAAKAVRDRGDVDAGISAAIKSSSAAAQKKASSDAAKRAAAERAAVARQAAAAKAAAAQKARRAAKPSFEEQHLMNVGNPSTAQDRAIRGLSGGIGASKGGKTVKKMATGRQTKADRQDESLGMRDGKESTKTQSYTSRRNESNATRRSTPRAPAPKPSSARQMSMLIPQHKRMAMGENVLTGKMINKFDGGKLQKTKTPKSSYATTGVNLNMGAPTTRRTPARGKGAALRGFNFTENT